MKVAAILLLTLILLPLQADAQSETFEFPAARLSDVAAEYTGASQNWPVVSSLANYNATTNRFQLGSSQMAELSRFRDAWAIQHEARSTFSQLVMEGGRVFAANELMELDSLFTQYRRLVNEAEIDASIVLASEIGVRVDAVFAVIEERRKADIEARLEQRTGQVDRRRGLIGEWFNAVVGELFQRSDGIRTGRESQAQLVFLDGSDVVLYENTTAIIRQSQVDKLTNRSEVEIELSNGGVLTRLSVAARNQSDYRVNAGTSTTNVRSNNFWAASEQGDRVILSNYDGEVLVSAEQAEVILQENQGTVVVRGREPAPPVALLPAPSLLQERNDTIIYTDNVMLQWNPIAGASFYETDLSRSRTFDAGLRTFRTEVEETEIDQVPEGVSYAQVRAYDINGLRGNNSSPLRILRISSRIPPAVILDTRGNRIAYALNQSFQLSGTTQPGTRIAVNGNPTTVDENGRFSATLNVDGQVTATVVATDPAGNRREVQQEIRYVDSEALFDLNWSVPSTSESVTRAPRILVSGKAFDFMAAEVHLDGRTYRQRVGSSGDWGRSFRTGDASEITIRFTDLNTGSIIAEKTYSFVVN